MSKKRLTLRDAINYYDNNKESIEAQKLTDCIRDKATPFMMGNDMPHYTDKRFEHGRTVFLAKGYKLSGDYVKDVHYDYSDRLVQWSYDKADKARKQAIEEFPYPRTPAMYERYLQLYFDDDALQLIHVISGYNWATGYAYQCFGYTRSDS